MKNSNQFRQILFIILLATICMFSCRNQQESYDYNQAFALIEAGHFSQLDSIIDVKLSEHRQDSCIAHFIKSLNAYFAEEDSLLEYHRNKAFPGDTMSTSLSSWLKLVDKDTTKESPVASFVKSIYWVMQKDTSKAITLLSTINDNNQLKRLFDYSKIALIDSINFVTGGIPDDEPLVYKGTMVINKQETEWIPLNSEDTPANEKFQVTGGNLYTFFGRGRYEQKAVFGDWTYAIDKMSGDTLDWIPLLTDGALFTRTHGDSISASTKSDFVVSIDCEYIQKPVDYFGKYKIIYLDKKLKHNYPMLMVPYFKGMEDGEGSLYTIGRQFRIQPKHFRQGDDPDIRFFGAKNLFKIVERTAVSNRVYWVSKF